MRTIVLCSGHMLIPPKGILRLAFNFVAKDPFQSLAKFFVTLVVSLLIAQKERGGKLELRNQNYRFGDSAVDPCSSVISHRLVDFY